MVGIGSTQPRFADQASRCKLVALRRTAVAAALAVAFGAAATAQADVIFGTLSNFDIYFSSPDPVNIPGCEGAEIELEGVHSADIGGYYPAHFANRVLTEYTDSLNNFAGTRITYTGYNFPGAPTPGTLLHNPNPASTNGHQLTYSAGGEHFGFWLSGAQPTTTRFFWLDDVGGGTYQRIGTTPLPIPGPTWTYVPPVNVGQPPVLQVVVKVPEPVEPPEQPEQRPDSVWMKVYKVKLPNAPQDPAEMQALLLQLISDANPNNDQPDDPHNLVPDGGDPAEVESEWELLEGGRAPKERMNEDPLEDNDKLVIRRYEFYKYAGVYDEEHEPVTTWTDPGVDPVTGEPNPEPTEPPPGELGDFISANMVAAVVPEPATICLLLAGSGLMALRRRSRC